MRSSKVWTATFAILCLNISILQATPTPNDFDGDGLSDIGCYYPPGGNWYIFKSSEGFWETAFGYSGTIPVTGDFDGDGKTDIGCYYPPGGNWYIFKSHEGFWETQFGYAGTIPVTGDFDGDGKTDIGCYYPPGGNWYVFKSHEGFWETAFGYSGTVPVTGDFDGDGKTDIGCYYPPGGNWYVFKSHEGFWETQFGYGGTVPVTGDFDADGRTDIGCYYAPGGNWYVFKSHEGFWQTTFGYAGTIPVVGDFDGDGKSDIGCYYPPGGNWYVFQSAKGFWETTFGYSGTVPLGAPVSAYDIAPPPPPAPSLPLTWEPGKSIGPINLGDSYAAVKGKLGVPTEIRLTTDEYGNTMWSDYDSIRLSMSYVDDNWNGRLDDNEVVDGIFADNFSSLPDWHPQPWDYKGIQFGAFTMNAVGILGEPDMWVSSYSLWWYSLGAWLDFDTSFQLNQIYVHAPIPSVSMRTFDVEKLKARAAAYASHERLTSGQPLK